MGAIGGMLGTAGGVNGTGIKGPQDTDLAQGLTPAQVQQMNATSLAGQDAQNNLLNALQGQNGLWNQSNAQNANLALQKTAANTGADLAEQLANNGGIGNQGQVYQQGQQLNQQLAGNNGAANMAGAMAGQQGLNQQLAGSGGVGAQQNAMAGLQNTANRFQDVAEGRGPNPAQAMLNQQTGQNVANQAALMAGQRGAGGNVGLMARQAAQQGANTQQQAVGQGAVMQANQQMAGLQGMQGANTALGGMGAGLVGQTQAGINAQGAMAGQQVSQQQNQQQMLAGQAQNQVANQLGQNNQAFNQNLAANAAVTGQGNVMAGQQIAQTNAGTAAAQNQQTIGLNALAGLNTNAVGMQSSVNAANAGNAQGTMGMEGKLVGGGLAALGPGAVLATGAAPAPAPAGVATTGGATPVTNVAARGGYVGMAGGGLPTAPLPPAAPPPGPQSSFGKFLMGARGGAVQHDFRGGGAVQASTPAERAVKPGNDYANDKVKALLSEGEVVLPRTVMGSADPVKSAADFVAKVMARRKVKA